MTYSKISSPLLIHTLGFVPELQTLGASSCVCRGWNATLKEERAYRLIREAVENIPLEFLQGILVTRKERGFEFPETVEGVKALCGRIRNLDRNMCDLRMQLVATIQFNLPFLSQNIGISCIESSAKFLFLGEVSGQMKAIHRDKGTIIPLEDMHREDILHINVSVPSNIFVSISNYSIVVWSLDNLKPIYQCTPDTCILFVNNVVIYKDYIFVVTDDAFICINYKKKHLIDYPNFGRFGKILVKEPYIYISRSPENIYDNPSFQVKRAPIKNILEFVDNNRRKIFDQFELAFLCDHYVNKLVDINKLGIRVFESEILENGMEAHFSKTVCGTFGTYSQKFSTHSSFVNLFCSPFVLYLEDRKGEMDSVERSLVLECTDCRPIRSLKLDVFSNPNPAEEPFCHFDGNDSLFVLDSEYGIDEISYRIRQFRFLPDDGVEATRTDPGDEKEKA